MNARDLLKELEESQTVDFGKDVAALVDAFRKNGIDYTHKFRFEWHRQNYARSLAQYLRAELGYVVGQVTPVKDQRGEEYAYSLDVNLPYRAIDGISVESYYDR